MKKHIFICFFIIIIIIIIIIINAFIGLKMSRKWHLLLQSSSNKFIYVKLYEWHSCLLIYFWKLLF